jgi:hypothetical protein
MAMLRHEVWIDADGLPMCCLAGANGDAARKNLESGAKLVWTFEAESHFEAMTKYHQYLGREPYATEHPEDFISYPGKGFTDVPKND